MLTCYSEISGSLIKSVLLAFERSRWALELPITVSPIYKGYYFGLLLLKKGG